MNEDPFFERWRELRQVRELSKVEALSVILLMGGQILEREDKIDLERLRAAGRLTVEEEDALRMYREGGVLF